MAFTFFFRDLPVLEAVADLAIPRLVGRCHPKIWDAGCAMGQEPYSLAIILAEKMGYFAFNNVKIFASDRDESGDFGQIVERGVYTLEQCRRIPPHYLEKYFKKTADGIGYQVVDKVRSRVEYVKHDLLSLRPVVEQCDLILCKNVLLHLSPDDRIKVIDMFKSSLASGGVFATENTQKLPYECLSNLNRLSENIEIYQRV
jgi:chemotaxis protein methyltransferase CheR